MSDFWDNLDSEITPPERSVPLCLRGDLLASIEEAKLELQEALALDKVEENILGAGQTSRTMDLIDRCRELEAEARRQSHLFTVRGIGDKAWSDLLKQYAPTAKQRDELDVDHNPETFPNPAVAACLVKITRPDGTVTVGATEDNVKALRTKLTTGQWDLLYNTVVAINVGVVNLGKSAGSTEPPQGSETSSTTAAPEGSPEASS